MGDINTDKDDDLIDYNEVDPEDLIAGRTQRNLNKGDGWDFIRSRGLVFR